MTITDSQENIYIYKMVRFFGFIFSLLSEACGFATWDVSIR